MAFHEECGRLGLINPEDYIRFALKCGKDLRIVEKPVLYKMRFVEECADTGNCPEKYSRERLMVYFSIPDSLLCCVHSARVLECKAEALCFGKIDLLDSSLGFRFAVSEALRFVRSVILINDSLLLKPLDFSYIGVQLGETRKKWACTFFVRFVPKGDPILVMEVYCSFKISVAKSNRGLELFTRHGGPWLGTRLREILELFVL